MKLPSRPPSGALGWDRGSPRPPRLSRLLRPWCLDLFGFAMCNEVTLLVPTLPSLSSGASKARPGPGMGSPGRSLGIWPASTFMPFGTASWTRSVQDTARGIVVGTFLAFDSDTGVPVSIGQFLRVVRPYFDGVLDVQNLSSYSFRRVVPTLAGIVRLTDTERLAIGQWTDAASGSSTAQTPLRYDARKQKQGHQLRLAAALFLASAPELLWEEIKTTSAVERWSEAMIAADELLSENPRVVRVSSDDIPGMPMVKSLLPASLAVIRTAGQKIIRALRKRAAATASTGSSSSPSQPKPTASPRLAPQQDEPPLQRRRLP